MTSHAQLSTLPSPDWLSPTAAGRKILYTPEDATRLSKQFCIMRAQVEVFAATPDDISVRAGRGGMKKESLAVGRVGIRCIHCSHLPLADRTKGAISFPNSVRIVYQAVRNFQRYHFPGCHQIPGHIKQSFHDCQGSGSHSKKDSQEYWVSCCERMGMVDAGTDVGIRFTCGGAYGASTSNSTEARPNVRLREELISSSEGRAGLVNSSPETKATNEERRPQTKPGNVSDMLEHAADKTAETDTDKLLDSVRGALSIVKRVREARGSGTPYKLTSSSTSLGYSPPSEQLIRHDLLVSLGSELYEHFAGAGLFERELGAGTSNQSLADSVAETQPMKKRERPPDPGNTPLRELGLPISLCILVSNLLNTKDGAVDAYHSAAEVEEDLLLISSNPERYLFGTMSDNPTGKLDFSPGNLYGRENQAATLMLAFHRVIVSSGVREMVLISGYSGVGKTFLVEQLREPLLKRRGHFISIKFYEIGQVQPMDVIFSAFNDFCSDLLQGDEEVLASVRRLLKEGLGTNIHVLTDVLPNLRFVVGEPTSAAFQIGVKEAFQRLLFYFRLFVRVIASPLHPLIVFLDDLQWADKDSLELLSMLLIDTEMNSILFTGCYRENEVGPSHPLKIELQNLSSYGVSILTIDLENIDRKSVHALVSDTLHLLPRVTQSLADVVYAKTSGNPLFVVQFLRSLCDEKLLRYSACSRRWEWDVESIQAKDIADNVVDLMTRKMLTLDPDVQWLLKVAACLGSQSQASILKLLSSGGDNDGSGILQFYDLAVNEGLMTRSGSCYKFSHDQIQQAAYSLIVEGEREALHLHMGKVLWKKSSEKELNEILFTVVDQLHRGSSLITDHDEKVEVARLCLMAGEQAIASSAFLQASICLLQGSTLVDERDWEDHYDLSLELFTCCAEAQYACGNPAGATSTLGPILKHGRCLEDKLRAHYILLNALGSQSSYSDAIKAGLDVLAQLGERFPSEVSQNDVRNEIGKTQSMLGGVSTDEILEKAEMRNTNKLAVMRLLAIVSTFAYQLDRELTSLIICRMVQLSICHGVSKETPFAFVTFGWFLNSSGDLKNGYEYGKLAIALVERLDAKEYQPHVFVVAYDAVVIFKDPMQTGLPSLKQGFEIGMSTGNVEWAMTSANMYCVSAIHCGSKLDLLSKEVRSYAQQMKNYSHHMYAMTLPCLQAVQNLMGDGQDPTNLTGEAMDQNESLNSARETQQFNVICLVYIMRMWLAYMFGRHDVAAEMVAGRRSLSRISPGGTMICETFYTGLIAAVMARGEASGQWSSTAHEALAKIKVWAQQSAWNFQHKVDLLRAEISYHLEGDLQGAATAYDSAICLAGKHGFVHEQALACERAGMLHSITSGADVAADYFERAKKYYLEWGASRKAQDLARHVGGRQAGGTVQTTSSSATGTSSSTVANSLGRAC